MAESTLSNALVADAWSLDVVRGPEWLMVRIEPNNLNYEESFNIANRIWGILQTHFTYRLVLDMSQIEFLPSHLMGQLIILQKRVLQQVGALRLCCLRLECQQSLCLARLDAALPNHESREEAMLGVRSIKPR